MTRSERWSIGEFARRSRLPASTLRYYDQLGVLPPSWVDPTTGYRYYDRAQLPDASFIVELRRLGVRPEVIIAVMKAADPGVILAGERRRIEAEIAARARALQRLDDLLDAQRRKSHYAISIAHRPDTCHTVQYGTMRAEYSGTDLRRLAVALRAQMRDLGEPRPEGFSAMFPLELEQDPVPVAVYITSPAPAGAHPLPQLTIPTGWYGETVHHGTQALEGAYDRLIDVLTEQGHEPVGPVMEHYLGTKDAPITRIAVRLVGETSRLPTAPRPG